MKVTHEDLIYRQELILSSVSRGTRAQYLHSGARISRETELSYEGFVCFMRRHDRLATGTLRGYKSALVSCLRLLGRKMTTWQDEDLNIMLNGHEVRRAATDPRKPRGAITQGMLDRLVQRARGQEEHTLADAFILANGCALRQQDLVALTAADVHFALFSVRVPRKDKALNKVRKGAYDERPIATKAAEMVLRRLVKCHRRGPLFPGWSQTKANAFIQGTAVAEGWSEDFLWDGMHCHRHGAAVEAKREVMQEVQKRGSWKTPAMAEHYSRNER